MRRAAFAFALGAMLLGALTACGRKGDLEKPPSAELESTREVVAA